MLIEANLNWRYEDTKSGLILPWYVLTCLEWLVKQDVSQWNVFEYGAGYSTIWWRAHCKEVRSFDHSKAWAKAMGAIHEDSEELFASAVDPCIELYDCIIIDGIVRFECLEFCRDYVANGGYIIIDNWNGEDFPRTKEALELLSGWECQIFKQPNHSVWQTAIFKKHS